MNLQSKLRKWWRGIRAPFEPPVAYSVECACGATITGTRNVRSQVRVCSVCKGTVFVLGKSPLPPLKEAATAEGDSAVSASGPARNRFRRLRWPAAALALVCIAGIAAFIVIRLVRPGPSLTPDEQLRAHVAAGQEAWDSGDYRTAARELHEARRLQEQLGEPMASQAARRMAQRERQAELVAAWLGRPLFDLLDQWQAIGDDDVQKLFAERRGKAAVFDILISRDGSGNYRCERHLGRMLPTLDLRDLEGLRSVPLRAQQRLIFGARLAALARDRTRPANDMQRWTVSFEPDSFVLITEQKIAKALHLSLDDEAPAVVERQAELTVGKP